ncbi:glycosyltransferase [Halopseudomonas pachastrellae]|nr:glycosyltransferase [Halopseudomonas pachastrellae]
MSYNNARFIGETIESVLSQQDVALELIIVDDCSSDDSLRRAALPVRPEACAGGQYREPGQTGNFNKCVGAAPGAMSWCWGPDDILYPGHLSALVEARTLTPSYHWPIPSAPGSTRLARSCSISTIAGILRTPIRVGATRSLIC